MSLGLLSLKGLRALVTGAGAGLGKQMALGLAEAGADLVICGRRREPLEECAAEAKALGIEVSVITGDVTIEEDSEHLVKEAGRIDVLVNNAGTADKFKPWTEATMDDWRAVMDITLDAPFRLIQLFAPPMIQRRWGGSSTSLQFTAWWEQIRPDNPAWAGTFRPISRPSTA